MTTCKALLFIIASAWALPIVEQPAHNTFMLQPRWQYVIKRQAIFDRPVLQTVLEMARFYAASLKPSAFFSEKSLHELAGASKVPEAKRRKLTHGAVTVVHEHADGRNTFQGGPGLKQTQEYTPEFGAALLYWYVAWEKELKKEGILVLTTVLSQ